MFELTNLDAIQIGMASPDQIREWSHGEVTKPETINYRTLKPERDGLYCERIFGPTKDWECNCGKYKRIKYKDKDKICDKCGVQVTRAKVRRERMGHIELAAPVSHIWYYKGIPSRMGMLLDISPRVLDKVLYFASYIVLDPGETDLKLHETINDERYRNTERTYGRGSFKAMMGAEAVREMLKALDLDALSVQLKEEIATLASKEHNRDTEGQKRARAMKRLEVVEAFRASNNKPEWMILEVLPVIPPDLRPMVQLDGGRFATSDLNDLYRRVINRNNRLKRLLELGAPDIIVRNEKRMLQESVDALIDNGRRGRPVTGPGNRPLKSLSHLLSGKQGRFRQNLLGKRVDYSGRSVIVVGPELKLHQCGLPKEMALELFKPFVMQRLQALKIAHNVKSAKRAVEKMKTEVWDILEEVIKEHPVLLNRAPTLHRLGIQAFEPILVEGKAIKLHPLACTAFNADFDGDQMAVHVPLSMEAQAEARFLMLAHNNILKPQDGKPVISPSQDMVIGCYYLTIVNENGKGAGRVFRDPDEAQMAYSLGQITLQSPIRVRVEREFNGEKGSKIIDCTLGRLIFNDALPQTLGFKKRECLDDMFALEVDELVGKKQLSNIVDMCFRSQGEHQTALVLDAIKALGYKYSTRGAVTVSVADIKVPPCKAEMLEEADKKVAEINEFYQMGMLTEDQRYERVIELWNKTTHGLRDQILPNLDKFNPIRMMTDSGARGSSAQVSQLAGMRGLMASPTGKTVELPIRANFREGLNVLEFFLSSHGSRKALSDTAMKTADSGYLTRRLVDVSQEVIVREEDCFESRGEKVRGITVTELMSGKQSIESLEDRLRGRTAAEDILHPVTGEVLVALNEAIDHAKAKKIVEAGVTKAQVRSVLTCRTEYGVCARCYGQNMAHGGKVDVGEAVGIIAAQAIGEPGTQLTMRTFHTGGIASGEDITQGLPRVEELFEARKPKREAVLADISGVVSVQDAKKGKRELIITAKELHSYTGPNGTLKVKDGETVKAGDVLITDVATPRNPTPHDVISETAGVVRIVDAGRRNEITVETDETKAYPITYGSRLKVQEGDHVEAGDMLIEGSINPHDLLRILGVKAVQEYLLKEVLSVYRLQGVAVSDKHIEIIVHQMLRKVRVEDAGDTTLLPGSLVDIFRLEAANQKALMEGGRPASVKRVLLGITKASLATESFMSAASFQETNRVLTEAAIKGKIDPLIGLKENVILGKLIPAGTGMRRYKNIDVRENYEF
ncbi:MAG: DNA-directed RNA polymerase subunit beta' [Clostridiales bacterium]|nr:DNA-directed RNA polymerase subunit beta' [Clostridiales bacterium]